MQPKRQNILNNDAAYHNIKHHEPLLTTLDDSITTGSISSSESLLDVEDSSSEFSAF
jgi:hypothetical protein